MPEVRTTSSTGGQKGTKLARFDLLPVGPLTELAEHYGVGASKYANHQWRKGYEWSKSYSALMRHLTAFWAGYDFDVCSNDPEGCSHVDLDGNPFVAVREDACFNHTGSHHMAAVAWHSFLLLEFKDAHQGHDDRYRPAVCGETIGPVPKLDGEVFTCTLPPHGDDVDHEDDTGALWAAQRRARQAAEEKQSGMSYEDRHRYATEGLEPDEDIVVNVREGFDIPEPEAEVAHQQPGHWSVGERAEDLVEAEEPVRFEHALKWIRDYDTEHIRGRLMQFEAHDDRYRPEPEVGPAERAADALVTLAGARMVDVPRWIEDFYAAIERERRSHGFGPDLLPKHPPTRWERG